MNEPTDRERIVALETKQDYQDGFNKEVITHLESIDAKVGVITTWIQTKTGFIAGILFCVSIIAACIGAFSSSIWKYFTEHHQ